VVTSTANTVITSGTTTAVTIAVALRGSSWSAMRAATDRACTLIDRRAAPRAVRATAPSQINT
jgi:hypothetical protein